MVQFISRLYQAYLGLDKWLPKSHVLVALAARLYIVQVFFSAGLTKIQDWDTTLFLFEEEYHVPLIPFELAAYLGTFGELILPLLLLIGLATRFAAIGLFIVNFVAVISLIEIPVAALYLHYLWGILLAQLAIYGGGALSADQILAKVTGRKAESLPAQ